MRVDEAALELDDLRPRSDDHGGEPDRGLHLHVSDRVCGEAQAAQILLIEHRLDRRVDIVETARLHVPLEGRDVRSMVLVQVESGRRRHTAEHARVLLPRAFEHRSVRLEQNVDRREVAQDATTRSERRASIVRALNPRPVEK